MATADVRLEVRFRDLTRTKLFLLQLRFLRDEMRVMASPHAEALERLMDRYENGGDDEAAEE